MWRRSSQERRAAGTSSLSTLIRRQIVAVVDIPHPRNFRAQAAKQIFLIPRPCADASRTHASQRRRPRGRRVALFSAAPTTAPRDTQARPSPGRRPREGLLSSPRHHPRHAAPWLGRRTHHWPGFNCILPRCSTSLCLVARVAGYVCDCNCERRLFDLCCN